MEVEILEIYRILPARYQQCDDEYKYGDSKKLKKIFVTTGELGVLLL
jgi:hypothetical protein